MRSRKKYFITAVVVFMLVIVQFRNPEISGPFKGIAGNILNPFVYYINRAGDSVANVWKNYIWLVGVSSENRDLRNRLDTLTIEYSILTEKVFQLEKLSQMSDLKDTFAFSTVAANVVSRNTDGYVKSILIDRGSVDNININDPVVSASGLVGRVTDVYRKTSRVVLLYHHESSVSVINSKTRAVGMLKGDGHGGLYVDYYDRLDKVQVGDTFITSGMGKLYPKGIKVGNVKSVHSPSTGLFQKLVINSSVDFYKLEQVLVVIHDRQLDDGSSEQL